MHVPSRLSVLARSELDRCGTGVGLVGDELVEEGLRAGRRVLVLENAGDNAVAERFRSRVVNAQHVVVVGAHVPPRRVGRILSGQVAGVDGEGGGELLATAGEQAVARLGDRRVRDLLPEGKEGRLRRVCPVVAAVVPLLVRPALRVALSSALGKSARAQLPQTRAPFHQSDASADDAASLLAPSRCASRSNPRSVASYSHQSSTAAVS